MPLMTWNLLALETSSAYCGVALLREEDGACTVRSRVHEGVQEHAERLLPMADELLAEAGLAPADLHAVAFGQGPGAFTGLRVACGVAQGMGLALELPVLPVVSHQAVAAQVAAAPDDIVAVAMDARMGEVYLAAYRAGRDGDWRALQPPVLMPAPAVPGWLAQAAAAWQEASPGKGAPVAAGDAWQAYAGEMPLPAGWRRHEAARPDAEAVARQAWRAWQRGQAVAPDAAAPLYVRDKVAYTTAERLQGEGGNPRAAVPPAAGTPAPAAEAGRAGDAVRIEAMGESDLDAVADIEHSVQSFPWTRGNFADALAAGYSAWVLRQAGRVCGFCVAMTAPDVAHLLVIGVARDRQGRGLGARLLGHCEDTLRRAGAPALLLEVRPSNDRALAFYRRRGYAQVGLRRGYYPAGRGGREDALVMRKVLAPAAPTLREMP